MLIPIDRIRCKSRSTCLSSDIRFSKISQLFCNTFSLCSSDLILENSATILLGSYRYCLRLLSTVKSLLGSSIDNPRLSISSLNCLYSSIARLSTLRLSKVARLCLISSSSRCFSSSFCLIWLSNSSSGIDSDLDNCARSYLECARILLANSRNWPD